ncbi:vancomycin high temperature exclusion protein [Gordonia paraffinivorans]|uniref:Vancomycin high temperature exclusion protein n=2 Tax=Gordonia paraffinivorans TaxID=175628 RepID=A0ABD7V4U7_9ACTN|nr:vancomycin high temperature exclusion protein [Gordonia paraffinivorans]
MRSAARLIAPVALIVVELWITVAATWMYVESSGRIVDAGRVSEGSTLLVLGSLVYDDGTPGDYVRGRLDTAAQLYRTGRVDRIINSGNGSEDAGNEPAVMRAHLEAAGVPPEAIVDDPEGYDTAASCRRAHEDFGADALVVVTQDFHLPRAIALCRDAGVDARGVVAECDCPAWTVVRNHIREKVFAGPKALLSAVG